MESQFPELKIIPQDRLILHEEFDPKRAAKLAQRIKKDGYFKNPIIAAEINHGSKFLVLDGVHRITALKKLNCRNIVVQLVDYFNEGLKVYTWGLMLLGCRKKELLKRIEKIGGIKLDRAEKGKNLVGYLIFNDGDIFLLKAAGNLKQRAEKLVAVVDACGKVSKISRVLKSEIKTLLKSHKEEAAVLTVPDYEKKDILELALIGVKLPAGITRHIIPNRVLGLDIKLSLLKNNSSLNQKNKMLRKIIAQKTKEKRIRFYPESVFIFDE
ncbi:ParB N-terminal domain-containing protein [Patescibacteria group bacterium]|nr:ParB N-terminal domain-containing protein [Patescibacteria group bacterium]MBU4481027.1 ParB N-terminal domain-containing protein [Patescibacteria group bacterium]